MNLLDSSTMYFHFQNLRMESHLPQFPQKKSHLPQKQKKRKKEGKSPNKHMYYY